MGGEESVLSPEPMGGGLLLKKPLSDSDFCTPDNSIHERRSSRKHMGEQLPKLPEFSMPDVDLEGKALSGHDSASEDKTDSVLQSVASALLRKVSLSESNVKSNFITSDNDKRIGLQILKPPQFGM